MSCRHDDYSEKQCKYCGKTYYITKHRLKERTDKGYDSNYCSKFCQFEDLKTKETITCQNCGRQFYNSSHPNVKYCCKSCKADAFRKKYPVVDSEYFEYILNKYKNHIQKWCYKYGDILNRFDLYEYAIYGIFIRLSQAIAYGFDIIKDKDSPLENVKIHDGLKAATNLLFREIVTFRNSTVSLDEIIFDLEDMRNPDNFILEKVKELHKNLGEESLGMKYLLKITLEGKTIEDIMNEEKLPYDIVYNRIYHMKKRIDDKKGKGLWIS